MQQERANRRGAPFCSHCWTEGWGGSGGVRGGKRGGDVGNAEESGIVQNMCRVLCVGEGAGKTHSPFQRLHAVGPLAIGDGRRESPISRWSCGRRQTKGRGVG